MKLLYAVLVTVASVKCESLVVSTPLGDVVGSTLTSRLGKTIYAFRSIRYAQPPVGDLRFKPPLPVEKWNGTYNATTAGPICPQPIDNKNDISEDCLVLNVYTTQLPSSSQNVNRSVIIYIHAGGYYSVSGRSDIEGPQYFTDQEIVLVTINYRLGSLGFISTGKDAPGNNGLKDQVLALKWVRDNIASFGGNPNSVTLFGYSAGAWSISLHLVSPMSRGLFHRAILGSGSAIGQWQLPKNQLELAKKQARLVGCPDDGSPEDILDCLKKVPAESLGNSLDGFWEFDNNDPILIWFPVIEDDYGQERFLPEDPVRMYQRGDFAKVPIIAGVTKDEFGYKSFAVVDNETLSSQLNNNFETYAPIICLYERGTAKSKEASAAIRKFYLGDEIISKATRSCLGKIYEDSVIAFPVNRLVNLVAANNPEGVYYYRFTYQGRFSHFYLPGTNNTAYSVVHHDDLIYLFYISFFSYFNETFPEREMVEKLTLLWSTFAQTGKPIPESGQIFEGINWEPYTNSNKKYLDIGKEIILKEGLHRERYDFWDQLFPLTE